MNTAAVKHQPYDMFCYPLNSEQLQISIETGTDITSVYLICGDPFQSEYINGSWVWQSHRIPITCCRRLPDALLWTVTVAPQFKRIKYYFELHDSEDSKLLFEDGFYSAAALSGTDGMEITVAGNDERILLVARYDNLGKGASGAAVQCLNLVLGAEETTGLEL